MIDVTDVVALFPESRLTTIVDGESPATMSVPIRPAAPASPAVSPRECA
jgi:hypothetical protein